MFNNLAVVKVGGNKDVDGNIIHYLNGIIAGAFKRITVYHSKVFTCSAYVEMWPFPLVNTIEITIRKVVL